MNHSSRRDSVQEKGPTASSGTVGLRRSSEKRASSRIVYFTF